MAQPIPAPSPLPPGAPAAAEPPPPVVTPEPGTELERLLSQRELAVRFCAVAGAPAPSVAAFPAGSLTLAGVVSAQMRELKETRYQFDRPFLLDSSDCTATFGIEATPRDAALTAVADAARAGSLAAAA